jgi:hypothetical protein
MLQHADCTDETRKINVKAPVFELDENEMTRTICGFSKDKLILPYPGEFEGRLSGGALNLGTSLLRVADDAMRRRPCMENGPSNSGSMAPLSIEDINRLTAAGWAGDLDHP